MNQNKSPHPTKAQNPKENQPPHIPTLNQNNLTTTPLQEPLKNPAKALIYHKRKGREYETSETEMCLGSLQPSTAGQVTTLACIVWIY